jgi:tetratricopeptide (TPR) repeat protein
MMTNKQESKSGKWFNPRHALLWIASLVLGAALFYGLGRMLEDKRDEEMAWNADDRLGLLSLEDSVRSASGTNLPMVNPLLQAEEAFVAQLGMQSPDGAAALNRLGNLYALQGDYPAAESAYRQVRSVLIEHLGARHADVLVVERNLRFLAVLRTNPVLRASAAATPAPSAPKPPP